MFTNQQATMDAPVPAVDDIPENPIALISDFDENEEAEAPPTLKKSKLNSSSKKASPVTTYKAQANQFSTKLTGRSVTDSGRFVFGRNSTRPPISASVAEPEKPKVDVSSVAVGGQVRHSKFGAGKVISLDSRYITVRSAEGKKRFVFPDSLQNGFLKL